MNANGMYNDAALRPNLYQSGFDPRQFLRLNTNEEGRREWSLDTAFKKLWFRTIYPNGRICTTVLEKDERHICINARVYADRMDPPDSYLAEGKAERFAPGDPASAKPYELYFADWAETVAIGRALTNAGFDVPFVNVLQDGLLLDPFTGEVLEENGGLSAFLARLPLKLKRLLGLGPGPGGTGLLSDLTLAALGILCLGLLLRRYPWTVPKGGVMIEYKLVDLLVPGFPAKGDLTDTVAFPLPPLQESHPKGVLKIDRKGTKIPSHGTILLFFVPRERDNQGGRLLTVAYEKGRRARTTQPGRVFISAYVLISPAAAYSARS